MIGYDLSRISSEGWSESFEWNIPETYNIAESCLDAPSEGIALRVIDVNGDSTTVDYSELREAVYATATALKRQGVDRDSTIGVCLPNCPELVVSHLAVLALGGVVVPVSMLLGDEHLEHVIEHSEMNVLLIDAEKYGAHPRVDFPDTTLEVTPAPAPTHDGLGGLTPHAVRHRNEDSPPTPTTSPDDPAFVLYTSGTTGSPKGVLHGHRYLLGTLPGYQCWFEFPNPKSVGTSRIYTPAEWAWAGGLFNVLYPTLTLGGSVVCHTRREGFDPQRAVNILRTQEVTHTFLPPTALRQIRRGLDNGTEFPSLQVINCGGEKLPTELQQWAEESLDVVVNEAYGQTEANALVGECDWAYETPDGSMGKQYPGHDIEIVDKEGNPVPDGEVGLIALQLPDPVCFLEYLNDPQATSEAFLDEKLFCTGDLGVRDEDGFLYHRGRSDSLILTSGYRVSPLEIESILDTHPNVEAAAVSGVRDPSRGERIVAAIVPIGSGSDDLRDELTTRVRDELGPHKTPREIRFVEKIPKTRTGKADRQSLFSTFDNSLTME